MSLLEQPQAQELLTDAVLSPQEIQNCQGHCLDGYQGFPGAAPLDETGWKVCGQGWSL